MTTLTEFQATCKSFDLTNNVDPGNADALSTALDSLGWMNGDNIWSLEGYDSTEAHFYEFAHSDTCTARYIIVKNGKGRFVNAWTMGDCSFDTLEAAEEDLLEELNG
jgi:hypothetical protein